MYSNIVVVLPYIWWVYFMVKYFWRIIGFGAFRETFFTECHV